MFRDDFKPKKKRAIPVPINEIVNLNYSFKCISIVALISAAIFKVPLRMLDLQQMV